MSTDRLFLALAGESQLLWEEAQLHRPCSGCYLSEPLLTQEVEKHVSVTL